MSETLVRDGYRYTKDHEWARKDGDEWLVGITAFAVEQLGDITLVSVDAKVGEPVVEGKAFGSVESVKTVSDLFAPMSGAITRVNDALTDRPELLNEDCYDKGWICAIRSSGDDSKLMDADAYRAMLATGAH